jgi:hypothetical protein
MACKTCSSINLQAFSVESTVVFPGLQRLALTPVYVHQKTLVCLDCGYSELVFPATELEKLRKGMNGYHRKAQIDSEYSRFE